MKNRIYGEEAQLVLKEVLISTSATYEPTKWGRNTKYVTITGNLLKEKLLQKIAVRHETVTIIGGKSKWWKKYGEEARSIAKMLHLSGPNIKKVAPIITPELIEIKHFHISAYDTCEENIADEILREIIEFLASNEYIERHPSSHQYRLTSKGGSHYDRRKYGYDNNGTY